MLSQAPCALLPSPCRLAFLFVARLVSLPPCTLRPSLYDSFSPLVLSSPLSASPCVAQSPACPQRRVLPCFARAPRVAAPPQPPVMPCPPLLCSATRTKAEVHVHLVPRGLLCFAVRVEGKGSPGQRPPRCGEATLARPAALHGRRLPSQHCSPGLALGILLLLEVMSTPKALTQHPPAVAACHCRRRLPPPERCDHRQRRCLITHCRATHCIDRGTSALAAAQLHVAPRKVHTCPLCTTDTRRCPHCAGRLVQRCMVSRPAQPLASCKARLHREGVGRGWLGVACACTQGSVQGGGTAIQCGGRSAEAERRGLQVPIKCRGWPPSFANGQRGGRYRRAEAGCGPAAAGQPAQALLLHARPASRLSSRSRC